MYADTHSDPPTHPPTNPIPYNIDINHKARKDLTFSAAAFEEPNSKYIYI